MRRTLPVAARGTIVCAVILAALAFWLAWDAMTSPYSSTLAATVAFGAGAFFAGLALIVYGSWATDTCGDPACPVCGTARCRYREDGELKS